MKFQDAVRARGLTAVSVADVIASKAAPSAPTGRIESQPAQLPRVSSS